jgi:sugar lactone lactonase YvrE
VRYILAGYSLGAWAVHDALHELGSRLAEIAGLALFGDPKFQPGQPFVRDFKSEDKYYGVAYKYQPQYNSIPPALVNQTGSWCLPADPVCQYRSDDISTWQSEVLNCVNLSESCAHFQYETDVETLRNAAAFLSPFLPHLYWAYLDQGTIVEANLDGSSPRTIVTGQNGPIGVAVGSSHIYWADGHAGTIMQANLDGNGVTTLVSGQIDAYGVAVNRSHIYWTVVDTGAVMEANLDGTGITTLESGQNTPALMAVDRSHIYWTDEDAGTVMEANLNGTGITTLESGQNSPNGVTVDRSHIYWTDAFGGTVMEANLDGSGVTALVSGQNIPRGVAVGNSHIYWAGGGSIMEANLDGTGVTALEAFQYAIGVAVGPQ